jgi:N-acetylglucosamine-6-phosphate deacetylase
MARRSAVVPPLAKIGDNRCLRKGNVTTIYNAGVILQDAVVRPGWVRIEDGRIAALGPGRPTKDDTEALDVGGMWLAPGFIDIHVHGGNGADFMDGTPAAFDTITRFHVRHGVTALQAATTSAPLDDLDRVLDAARDWQGPRPTKSTRDFHSERCEGAMLLGVHLEGPFLSVEQRGAHMAGHIRPITDAAVAWLLEQADVVTEVTLAPELPGALALIRELVRCGIVTAAGHSQARLSDVEAAIGAGLRHVTHIYSGMSTFVREGPWRVPGLVEATLADDRLTTEMIGDGKHLPPAMMRLVVKCKAPDRLCLVSDAMRGAGLPEGQRLQVAGHEAIIEHGVAMLADHTSFAGSITPLDRMVGNMVHLLGLSLPEAISMATINPARVLGIGDRKGLIAPGKDADLVVLDSELQPQLTLIAGRVVYAWDEADMA